jgi:hypothetical protein
MRRRKLVGLISIGAIVAAVAWLYSRRLPAPAQALTVSFVGYTNLSSGKRAAVFVTSNQWNSTVMQWAGAWVERAPFALTDNPARSTLVTWPVVRGGYLKPRETAMVLVSAPFPDQEWRLRVQWSPGVQARISVATRKHSMLPDFLKLPTFGWAFSDSIPPRKPPQQPRYRLPRKEPQTI